MQTVTTRDDVASGWKYWGNLTKASNHNQQLRPLQVQLNSVAHVPTWGRIHWYHHINMSAGQLRLDTWRSCECRLHSGVASVCSNAEDK